MLDEVFKVRVSKDLLLRIKNYCQINKIDNLSEFFRRAAVKEITPDTSDQLLTFESLKDLHNKMHHMDSEISIFFNLFCYFVKHFFVYNPELPAEHIKAASISAKSRYDDMFSQFKKSLSANPAMFESLLADYFEEKHD